MAARRIAIFTTSYLPLIGGAQIAINEFTKRIEDYDYFLFCPKLSRSLSSVEQINKVKVYRIGFGANFDKYIFVLLAPFFALRIAGLRCIIWGMMANYGGFAAVIFNLLTLKRNKFLLSFHEGFTMEWLKKKGALSGFLVRKIFAQADYLQVVSSYSLDLARQLGYSSSNYSLIPNGVDIDRFKPSDDPSSNKALKERLRIQKNDKILFTASRLSEKNAVGDVVCAMAKLPLEYRFLIVGDGELQADIDKQIASLGLKNRVILAGAKSHEEVIQFLQISHIFIRTAIRESLGTCFLEAMAVGVPVVATYVGGIKDFLIDSENGVAATPKDIDSIVHAIRRYEDPVFYQKVRANAMFLIKEKYTWDLLSKQFRPIFQQLCA